MVVGKDAGHVFGGQPSNPLATDIIPVSFKVLVYTPCPQLSADLEILLLRVREGEALEDAEDAVPLFAKTAPQQGLNLPTEGLQHMKRADELPRLREVLPDGSPLCSIFVRQPDLRITMQTVFTWESSVIHSIGQFSP